MNRSVSKCVLSHPSFAQKAVEIILSADRMKGPHGTGRAGLQFVVDPSANSDTEGWPDTYAYIGPVIVPVIMPSVMVPIFMLIFIMNLSQVAVVCRIDLNRRSLWHSLAWRWHSENDTSRNRRGHGQHFDTKHDKSSFFH